MQPEALLAGAHANNKQQQQQQQQQLLGCNCILTALHLHLYCTAPSPQGDPERPYRRYDQNEEDMATRWAGAVTQALASGDAERTYRLDVAAGRCEFLLHPCMSREHQLVGGGGESALSEWRGEA
jgi:hypothetical protein